MLRAVLAVVVAVALLGAALPAVDRAGVDRSTSLLAGEAETLARAVERLATGSDPVPAGARGARAVVELRLPGRSWATQPADYLAVGAARRGDPPDGRDGDVVAYRVAGGRERTVRLPADVRAAEGDGFAPDDRPLVLAEPGRHALALWLVGFDGRPVVVVSRLGDARGARRPPFAGAERAVRASAAAPVDAARDDAPPDDAAPDGSAEPRPPLTPPSADGSPGDS